MGNLHDSAGVWYDIAGTDDAAYALGEVRITEGGNVYIQQYDSRGTLSRSLIGTIVIGGTTIRGSILNGKTTDTFDLTLLSPLSELRFAFVGFSDAQHFRVYATKPYMHHEEISAIKRICNEIHLPVSRIICDPVLTHSIKWNERTNVIVWPKI